MYKTQIKTKYHKLMNDVATMDFYKIDLTNRVNCYRCNKCGHITKTKDVDPGVTPFMFNCEDCENIAHSTMYNDIALVQQPTIEWYRPSLEETLKLDEFTLEHILQGGLVSREIMKDESDSDLEQRTEYNINLICVFAAHYENETGKSIEESVILSFFNA